MIKTLDWAMELRRHATTREIKLAAAECNITSVLNDADDWASLVTIIIIDEKNFEKIADWLTVGDPDRKRKK